MEDISNLLQEARPLYYTRRRRRQVGVFAGMLAICLIIVNFWKTSNSGLPVYDFWSEDVYMTDSGSPIEDMGLPVDDYGLLLIG